MSNKGVAEFTPTLNNPDGRTYKVDYNMPKENILKATNNWEKGNESKVNPFEELADIRYTFQNKGIVFGETCMSPSVYAWLINCPAVRRAIKGTDKSGQAVTPAELNAMLQQFELPAITLINKRNAVTEDGKRKTELINPWNDNVITLKPDGKIGEVQPALRTMLSLKSQTCSTQMLVTVCVLPSGKLAKAQGKRQESTRKQVGEHCLLLRKLIVLSITK